MRISTILILVSLVALLSWFLYNERLGEAILVSGNIVTWLLVATYEYKEDKR